MELRNDVWEISDVALGSVSSETHGGKRNRTDASSLELVMNLVLAMYRETASKYLKLGRVVHGSDPNTFTGCFKMCSSLNT